VDRYVGQCLVSRVSRTHLLALSFSAFGTLRHADSPRECPLIGEDRK
jgi:hypothetical protein